MTVKLKKQILRIGRFSVITLFLASFAILLAGAGKEERTRTIEEVAVEVAEEPGVWFVDEADVMRILGEMNVDELRHCALDPETRILRRITMDDGKAMKEAAKMFDTLMGSDVAQRREYLLKNSSLFDRDALDI